jgi:hypothetical protein
VEGGLWNARWTTRQKYAQYPLWFESQIKKMLITVYTVQLLCQWNLKNTENSYFTTLQSWYSQS